MGTYSAYKKLYQKVAADMPPFPPPPHPSGGCGNIRDNKGKCRSLHYNGEGVFR